MVKARISIPHVSWRGGRPRFNPGPALRAAGHKGMDLRHPDGRWFGVDEATAWVSAREHTFAAASRRGASAHKMPRQRGLYTVRDLFRDYFASPRLLGKTTVDGRRRQKALSAATIHDYKRKSAVLETYAPEIWGAAVAALDQPIVYGLYEELWRDKGLAMARGVVAVLSAAISWGMRRGKVRRLAVNPALRLGMQTPAPRLNAGEPDAMRALVAAADLMARPDIGDAIMLGLWTGQRQNDRLALLDGPLIEGRRFFRQSKTGAPVSIREAPELETRLAAARDRRAAYRARVETKTGAAPMLPGNVLLNETSWRLWGGGGDYYRHVFAGVRDAAVAGMADEEATAIARAEHARLRLNTEPPTIWKLAPCPALKDFHDQDLRDTAVTWLARAGCTIPEICAVTGHSEESATQILKHYLARHPELADSAIAKMTAWYDTKVQGA